MKDNKILVIAALAILGFWAWSQRGKAQAVAAPGVLGIQESLAAGLVSAAEATQYPEGVTVGGVFYPGGLAEVKYEATQQLYPGVPLYGTSAGGKVEVGPGLYAYPEDIAEATLAYEPPPAPALTVSYTPEYEAPAPAPAPAYEAPPPAPVYSYDPAYGDPDLWSPF